MTAIPPATENRKDPDQIRVILLYIAFIASALLVMSPIGVVSFLALFGLLLVMIVVGFIRREGEQDSLLYNHATYLSRTFWMWQLMLLIGMVLGGYYLSRQLTDWQQIMDLIQKLAAGQTDAPEFKMMAMVGVVAFGPGCLYAAYRLIHGLLRAVKGYRVARPKSFF